jgi:hypothetical protein
MDVRFKSFKVAQDREQTSDLFFVYFPFHSITDYINIVEALNSHRIQVSSYLTGDYKYQLKSNYEVHT